ncbi:MAG: four helix bundle protein [Tepidisphaeraceae bacterium]|jgi:four helix bundle protein
MQRSTLNTQRSTLKAEGIVQKRFEKNERFDLEDRLLRYAAGVVRLVEKIPNSRSGNHVGGQFLRSGTSVLPNHGEAQAAESPGDFLHKMRICLKELRESRRWLRLIVEVPLLKDPSEANKLLDETEQLIKIFAASVRTTLSKMSGKTLVSDFNVER